ncbi:MAG TPA: sugar transferase, partial [Pirellulales bacterium]|nr:sugar transferase [Pirellulales bacterium]
MTTTLTNTPAIQRRLSETPRRDDRRRVAPCGHLRPIAAEGNLSLGYRALKRLADVVGAALLLAAFSPVMLVTLLVLLVTTKGKPIFVQQRVGHCGRRFRMFKFRTMILDADKLRHSIANEQAGPVFKNRRDPRITPIGRFLRSTSIDELPQLFNVLAGDMTLVGPRAMCSKESGQCEPWQ